MADEKPLTQGGLCPSEGRIPVASPCTGICRVNEANICIDCERTLEEIAAWSRMDEHERQAVLGRLERERAAS
jgi:hypothetical protein